LWTISGSNVYYNSGGNVFIGSSSSSENSYSVFDVSGAMTVTRNIYLNNITESVYTYSSAISGGSITLDYMGYGSTILLTGTITSSNFTCALTNIPSLTNRACVVTLIMTSNTSTYYCSVVTVNGAAASEYFNGGAISTITTPSVVVQQLAIYYTGSAYYVLSNVSSFKTIT
jgi:hypothetical protein